VSAAKWHQIAFLVQRDILLAIGNVNGDWWPQCHYDCRSAGRTGEREPSTSRTTPAVNHQAENRTQRVLNTICMLELQLTHNLPEPPKCMSTAQPSFWSLSSLLSSSNSSNKLSSIFLLRLLGAPVIAAALA
jgi:hypothetical protein